MSKNTENDLVNQLGSDELTQVAKEHGAKLPEKWSDFDLNSRRSAVACLLSGGLTPFGFATLEPNFLEETRSIGLQAAQMMREIDQITNSFGKNGIN